MANNLIQVKRTSVSGRVPNTSNLSNPGELALNMTDGILYSTNGTVIFEIGANNTNATVSNTLTINTLNANGSTGAPGQVLTSNGTSTFWSFAAGGGSLPGGSNTNIQFNDSGLLGGTNAFSFDKSTNTVTIETLSVSSISANNTLGSNGQYLTTDGNTVYWSSIPTINTTSYSSYRYTAANNQTTFSGLDDDNNTLSYTPGYIIVFVNGIKILDTDDYIAITGNTVILNTGTSTDDVVEIISLETAVLTTDIKITDYITFDNNVIVSSNAASSNAASPYVADHFIAGLYRSAKYTIVLTHNTNQVYHMQEIMVLHTGSNVIMTEYAGLYSNGSALATFDANISLGVVKLWVNPLVSNTSIKVSKTLFSI